ncbi:sensor histidine kinase KdpD [uncultured Acetatifactor sp.]|uniref:sensor histidine kinase n=1 Tax=uncultured Acetatifactor sp. TaxID=1671927 RepID=UPI0026204B7E|nr:HAMP domain-containing sensor histidine kinase [uncultured Acetatifactor sp.]
MPTYLLTNTLRIEDHYNRNKLFPKIKDERKEYRELSVSSVEKYADAYKEFFLSQNRYENYKRFIDDIFHDIRKFNQQIKFKNDKIYRKAQQHKRYGDILEATKGIQQLGWFLTLRLNNHDFIYNKELLSADVKSSYNIFRIIDKVKKCIKERADEKNIKIEMNASVACRDMQVYDCIELLPYIFLDNAIKYSPNGEKIHIDIDETRDSQHVKIGSIGPVVNEDEQPKLFGQGYRGENAIKSTQDGMGIGLYTAKCICELNDIKLEIASSPDIIKKVKNIEYSEFSVNFWIKL